MVTAYDSAMAQLVDRSDVELLLVGDSVGLAALGYDGTDRVTLAEMLHHARAVTRVVEDTVVMVDLLFGNDNVSPEQTVENADAVLSDARAIDEADASGLVLELVTEEVAERITRAVDGVTIGIGAGPDCDAQVVTLHDLLGLQDLLPDTAAGVDRELGTEVVTTLDEFRSAAADGEFPSAVESMPEEAAREFEDGPGDC